MQHVEVHKSASSNQRDDDLFSNLTWCMSYIKYGKACSGRAKIYNLDWISWVGEDNESKECCTCVNETAKMRVYGKDVQEVMTKEFEAKNAIKRGATIASAIIKEIIKDLSKKTQ